MSADSSTNAAVSRNPFRPTFGVPPLYWVGRAAILDSFHVALEEGPGAFGRSMIISGTRGIGKTVLLTELEEQAAPLGWITLRASGRGNLVDTLVETTVPPGHRHARPEGNDARGPREHRRTGHRRRPTRHRADIQAQPQHPAA
ncbi:ATP-binding protein [Corynebacterium phoceense]|uniref:ATP-binding protein n=1 Tax=Corynebacterium phoceense TaxID=1686286 RepID=UPI00211CDAE0|nr:ATP-binding protein [Corynebacterium phoceense]MCQ9334782.1 ATP-binding protein [Corynebacterium phoceense]